MEVDLTHLRPERKTLTNNSQKNGDPYQPLIPAYQGQYKPVDRILSAVKIFPWSLERCWAHAD